MLPKFLLRPFSSSAAPAANPAPKFVPVKREFATGVVAHPSMTVIVHYANLHRPNIQFESSPLTSFEFTQVKQAVEKVIAVIQNGDEAWGTIEALQHTIGYRSSAQGLELAHCACAAIDARAQDATQPELAPNYRGLFIGVMRQIANRSAPADFPLASRAWEMLRGLYQDGSADTRGMIGSIAGGQALNRT